MVICRKIMPFFIFFNSLNQNFQQCTNVRRSQVRTSDFALFSINIAIIHIAIFPMFISLIGKDFVWLIY